MYYTFIRNQTTYRNVTFDDLLNNNLNDFETNHIRFVTTIEEPTTRRLLPHTKEAFLAMESTIQTFLQEHPDFESLYGTFRIPKRTGGFRTIEAPMQPLTAMHQAIKTMFDFKIKALPHDSAHAYVKTRGTVSANKVHQANESKWFLKMDMKDFFPSCNFDFIYKQLVQIFPFTILIQNERCDRILKDIIRLCLRNDKLPQGTKMSPLITNLIMVPIDYAIRETLGAQYRYTRYADDLVISSRVKFSKDIAIDTIKRILIQEETPLTIKDSKTRFGSSAGSNWNLGIMLNKDNNLTVGHKNKERFRAAIDNFIRDELNTNTPKWNLEDLQHLQGLISYYKMIEPDYIESVLTKYNTKHNVNIKRMLRLAINR